MNSLKRMNPVRRHLRTMAAVAVTAVSLWTAPNASASKLGDIAEAMQAGDWRELPADFLPSADGFWRHPAGSENITAYANRGEWDPIRRKMAFIGCGYGPAKLVIYDEATDSWTSNEVPSSFANIIHIWDHSGFDQARGILYAQNHLGSSVFQLNLATMAWSALPALPTTGETRGVTYFPEIDSLVTVDPVHKTIYALKSGAAAWTTLNSNIYETNYHPVAEHDRVRGVVYFGGGNNAPRAFFRLNRDGSVDTLASPPIDIDLGSGGGDTVTDPVSGRPIIRLHNASRMAEYIPEKDAWATVSTSIPSALTGTSYSFAVPISTYGVIMYVAVREGTPAVWLYKHKQSTTPADPPPAAPAGLRIR